MARREGNKEDRSRKRKAQNSQTHRVEKRGSSNKRRRPQAQTRSQAGKQALARKAAAKKRLKKKRLIRNIIVAILFIIFLALCLVLGYLAAKDKFSKSEDTSSPVSDTSASSSTVEQADLSAQSSSVDESIADTIEDIRKVKNTATAEDHKENGLAICMYHYVYNKDDKPDDLNSNYIEASALKEELEYLVDNDYYFPTWEEVAQYVKGETYLPKKSVVLTFDDGAKSFLKNGIPVINECEVPVTSFLIGIEDGAKKAEKYASPYVNFQSHSYNMHRAGGSIGHGGIFTALSHDDAVDDLKKSIEITGSSEAFAYPYGDYTDDCIQEVKDAGFTCAVTTENRRADVGDDPLLLPRVRMSQGQSLKTFISLVE